MCVHVRVDILQLARSLVRLDPAARDEVEGLMRVLAIPSAEQDRACRGMSSRAKRRENASLKWGGRTPTRTRRRVIPARVHGQMGSVGARGATHLGDKKVERDVQDERGGQADGDERAQRAEVGERVVVRCGLQELSLDHEETERGPGRTEGEVTRAA